MKTKRQNIKDIQKIVLAIAIVLTIGFGTARISEAAPRSAFSDDVSFYQHVWSFLYNSGTSKGSVLGVNSIDTGVFVKTDTTTKGDWKGVYGTDGDSIANFPQHIPSYAQVTFSGATPYTWANPVADVRALENVGNDTTHIATTYYGGTFTVDVSTTDDKSHEVALYFLDWEGNSRTQKVELINKNTGAVLDTRNLSNFNGGIYLVYEVSGDMQFKITHTGGPNGVLSGIFFKAGSGKNVSKPVIPTTPTTPTTPSTPTTPTTPTTSTASYVGSDGTTKGSWVGVYGKDGYGIPQLNSSFPSYAQVSMKDANAWTWHTISGDVRALGYPTGSNRLATTWYNTNKFEFNVNITDGKTHKVSLYMYDFENVRAQTIKILDAATGTVLDTKEVTGFYNGGYMTWNVSGKVTIQVINNGGRNAVVEGIFFDTEGSTAGGQQPEDDTASVVRRFNLPASATPAQCTANGWDARADFNKDGFINHADALIMGEQYNKPAPSSGTTADANGDKTVDFSDLVIMAQSYNTCAPAAPVEATPAATFIKVDSVSKGDWKGKYGSQGYAINALPASNPSYAGVTFEGTESWTWQNPTQDARGLLYPTNASRISSTWYKDGVFNVKVDNKDANTHQVALYMMDNDGTDRSQRIDVVNTATGALLDSRTVSSFNSSRYMIWNVKGDVTFKFTKLAGRNAVLSGVFFDAEGTPTHEPEPDPEPALGIPQNPAATAVSSSQIDVTWSAVSGATSYTIERSANGTTGWTKVGTVTTTTYNDKTLSSNTKYYYRVQSVKGAETSSFGTVVSATTATDAAGSTATFVSTDTTTKGDWKSKYGAEGYVINALTPNVPSYATISYENASSWTWDNPTTDIRALKFPTGANRIASTWYNISSFNIKLDMKDTETHQVALYMMDNDSNNRDQKVEVIDAKTAKVLDTKTVSNFNGGIYYVWEVNGDVTFKLTNLNTGVRNAVLSGIFFGTNSTYPSPTGLEATTVSKTQIDLKWTSVAGATGYTVERSPNGTDAWSSLGTVTTTKFEDKNLAVDTEYFYRVSATNGKQTSDFTDPVSGATLPEVVDPSGLIAPTFTSIEPVSDTQIKITWSDRNASEDGFKLERSVDSVNYTQIAAPAKGSSTYVDQNLKPGTKYIYRIRAYKGANNSTYSFPIIANAQEKFDPQYSSKKPTKTGGWISDAYPNRIDVMWDRRNQIYYVGEPVNITQRHGGWSGQHYEIRNYWGEVVDEGTLTGMSVRANVSEPGWYTLQVYHANGAENGVLRDVAGGVQFVIFRNDARFPNAKNLNVDTVRGDKMEDEISRAIIGIGPQRHNIKNAAHPDGDIAAIAGDIELDKQYYLAYNDTARPRDLLVVFSNGTEGAEAGVKKVVSTFKGTVKYYEGRNEPHELSPEEFARQTCDLYKWVKSVDPSAKVIGPATVDIMPGWGLAYIDRFLAAGGKNCIDAVSYHVYNNINGDIYNARLHLTNLDNVLKKHNLQNIERWQTEQGAFGAQYGSFKPRLQARWDMLMLMMLDQHGVPKEHNHMWYDKSGGFWDIPAFYEGTYGSLFAAPAMFRTMAEEVYGKKYVQAYDFGTPGNNLYVGNLYSGSNGNVAMFMSNGDTDGKITLNVSGASSLKVVSAFGVTSTINVVNGKATLDVPEIPVYVEFGASQSVSVDPTNWGANLARQAGAIVKASGAAHKINNGILDVDSLDMGTDIWKDDTPVIHYITGAKKPAVVEIDLPTEQNVKRVVVYSGVPFQPRGSILDYELQVDVKGQWVTVERIKEHPKFLEEGIIWMRTSTTSFYNERAIFQHELPVAIKTSKIRIVATEVTYGGASSLEVAYSNSQSDNNVLNLREIEIYGQ
jgi:fibronectin type 3 domain-containing protein